MNGTSIKRARSPTSSLSAGKNCPARHASPIPPPVRRRIPPRTTDCDRLCARAGSAWAGCPPIRSTPRPRRSRMPGRGSVARRAVGPVRARASVRRGRPGRRGGTRPGCLPAPRPRSLPAPAWWRHRLRRSLAVVLLSGCPAGCGDPAPVPVPGAVPGAGVRNLRGFWHRREAGGGCGSVGGRT